MFELTPLSRPVAIAEILVLLVVAAIVGWFMARLILNNRINALRSAIADQESELDDCRRSTASNSPVKVVTPLSIPVAITSATNAPIVGMPVPPVSAIVNSDILVPFVSVADSPLTLTPEKPLTDPIVIPSAPVAAPTFGSSEAAVLQRIAARAAELNFDRIGIASATEADDLKDIVGIGPFLERKLHSLGIYTFRQVANFAKEDIDKVNEIIEFFPGRIERDNWVDQATVFHERKYGKKAEPES